MRESAKTAWLQSTRWRFNTLDSADVYSYYATLILLSQSVVSFRWRMRYRNDIYIFNSRLKCKWWMSFMRAITYVNVLCIFFRILFLWSEALFGLFLCVLLSLVSFTIPYLWNGSTNLKFLLFLNSANNLIYIVDYRSNNIKYSIIAFICRFWIIVKEILLLA